MVNFRLECTLNCNAAIYFLDHMTPEFDLHLKKELKLEKIQVVTRNLSPAQDELLVVKDVVPRVPLPIPAAFRETAGVRKVGYRDFLTFSTSQSSHPPFLVAFRSEPNMFTKRVKIEGMLEIKSIDAERTVQSLTGSITVKVAVFGKTVEKIIVENIANFYERLPSAVESFYRLGKNRSKDAQFAALALTISPRILRDAMLLSPEAAAANPAAAAIANGGGAAGGEEEELAVSEIVDASRPSSSSIASMDHVSSSPPSSLPTTMPTTPTTRPRSSLFLGQSSAQMTEYQCADDYFNSLPPSSSHPPSSPSALDDEEEEDEDDVTWSQFTAARSRLPSNELRDEEETGAIALLTTQLSRVMSWWRGDDDKMDKDKIDGMQYDVNYNAPPLPPPPPDSSSSPALALQQNGSFHFAPPASTTTNPPPPSLPPNRPTLPKVSSLHRLAQMESRSGSGFTSPTGSESLAPRPFPPPIPSPARSHNSGSTSGLTPARRTSSLAISRPISSSSQDVSMSPTGKTKKPIFRLPSWGNLRAKRRSESPYLAEEASGGGGGGGDGNVNRSESPGGKMPWWRRQSDASEEGALPPSLHANMAPHPSLPPSSTSITPTSSISTQRDPHDADASGRTTPLGSTRSFKSLFRRTSKNGGAVNGGHVVTETPPLAPVPSLVSDSQQV